MTKVLANIEHKQLEAINKPLKHSVYTNTFVEWLPITSTKHVYSLSDMDRWYIISKAKQNTTLFVDLTLGTNTLLNTLVVYADVSLLRKPQGNEAGRKLLYKNHFALLRHLPAMGINYKKNFRS